MNSSRWPPLDCRQAMVVRILLALLMDFFAAQRLHSFVCENRGDKILNLRPLGPEPNKGISFFANQMGLEPAISGGYELIRNWLGTGLGTVSGIRSAPNLPRNFRHGVPLDSTGVPEVQTRPRPISYSNRVLFICPHVTIDSFLTFYFRFYNSFPKSFPTLPYLSYMTVLKDDCRTSPIPFIVEK
jgi:hypothetical protein